jgi:hypothetical protein
MGSAGNASSGKSGTESCATLEHDHCVTDCFDARAFVDNALCTRGAWSCPPGYVLASSCPALACGVTRDACCNLTTGLVTENACDKNGYRSACPEDSMEVYAWQPWCVPKSLERVPCRSLHEQPCTGPALACGEVGGGYVSCRCEGLGADASVGTWYCSVFLGP